MYDFGLVQPVDRLGQRVVVRIAYATRRQLNASVQKTFVALKCGDERGLQMLLEHAMGVYDSFLRPVCLKTCRRMETTAR